MHSIVSKRKAAGCGDGFVRHGGDMIRGSFSICPPLRSKVNRSTALTGVLAMTTYRVSSPFGYEPVTKNAQVLANFRNATFQRLQDKSNARKNGALKLPPR
jgi:hypothetical protein